MTHLLVVRLDSLGDMLVCGPAIRALAAKADHLTVLAGPSGAAAARLLPGVDDVLVWPCPWIDSAAPPLDEPALADVVAAVRTAGPDRAVVLTSFHQSAPPTALVLRLAGVGHIVGVSTDFPGSLLDVRLPEPADGPEPLRMLEIARGAGADLAPGDEGRLAIRPVAVPSGLPSHPYVVAHPGVTATARAYPPQLWREVVGGLSQAGWDVVVTGTAAESGLVAAVTSGPPGPGRVHPAAGTHDLAGLAALLSGAVAVVVANTGPAHLAAAVGTPVVSLFAPVVPASRWAPFGVPTVVLGDQAAACRDSRARVCPSPGHPCLAGVAPAEVVQAVHTLVERAQRVAS